MKNAEIKSLKVFCAAATGQRKSPHLQSCNGCCRAKRAHPAHSPDLAPIDFFLFPMQHTFVSPSAFPKRAAVSYWRKYVHEVLVNRLRGLSLPRKSVVRLIDRPEIYRYIDIYIYIYKMQVIHPYICPFTL